MPESTTETIQQENSTKMMASYSDLIETVISSLEQNDSAMVDEQKDLWKFQYGSVEVFVQLTGETDEDLLTVWSPVLKFPVKDEVGLMRKLLEMNWGQMMETHFSIVQERVVVSSQRALADLSPGEISRAITLVATLADEHDDALKAQFGGS